MSNPTTIPAYLLQVYPSEWKSRFHGDLEGDGPSVTLLKTFKDLYEKMPEVSTLEYERLCGSHPSPECVSPLFTTQLIQKASKVTLQERCVSSVQRAVQSTDEEAIEQCQKNIELPSLTLSASLAESWVSLYWKAMDDFSIFLAFRHGVSPKRKLYFQQIYQKKIQYLLNKTLERSSELSSVASKIPSIFNEIAELVILDEIKSIEVSLASQFRENIMSLMERQGEIAETLCGDNEGCLKKYYQHIDPALKKLERAIRTDASVTIRLYEDFVKTVSDFLLKTYSRGVPSQMWNLGIVKLAQQIRAAFMSCDQYQAEDKYQFKLYDQKMKGLFGNKVRLYLMADMIVRGLKKEEIPYVAQEDNTIYVSESDLVKQYRLSLQQALQAGLVLSHKKQKINLVEAAGLLDVITLQVNAKTQTKYFDFVDENKEKDWAPEGMHPVTKARIEQLSTDYRAFFQQ